MPFQIQIGIKVIDTLILHIILFLSDNYVGTNYDSNLKFYISIIF